MKFRITFKSFSIIKIQDLYNNIKAILTKNNCKSYGLIILPTKIKKFCIVKSPNGNKDSREYLELREHKAIFNFDATNLNFLSSLLKKEMHSDVLWRLIKI